MTFFAALAHAAACQGDPAPAAASRPAIEVFVGGKTVAKVTPGHPCRASINSRQGGAVEILAGGPPLLATVGDVRWTAESASNGTTFKKNDEEVARIHANQLFDGQGIPLIKVIDGGTIANGPGRVVRKATAVGGRVEITTMIKQPADDAVVTNTDDLVLAAMLSAPEADPTIRGLVACHLLQAAGT